VKLATGAIHLAPGRRLSLSALISVAFFTTCGGAFGLEPLIGAVGPGWAFLVLFLTPLLWSIPIALMVAELSTLMPEEGGYYIWVREALGPFWAVQEAWWTIGYSLMLMAIFPGLFASYLGYLLPDLATAMDAPGTGAIVRWLIALAVIGTGMIVNWFGARDVGWSSKAAITFVLVAFAVFIGVWLARDGRLSVPIGIIARDLSAGHKGVVLLGLSIVILNYGGYDNIATYAGEVERPRVNYPIALVAVIALAVLSYSLPVVAGIGVTTDPAVWSANAGWPVIGGRLGGPWLGGLLAAAGMVSTWAMFNAQLLYTSRIPYVLARDGWVPEPIARADGKTGAPRASILLICLITGTLAALSFDSLVIIMSILYTGALLLEFVALLKFRMQDPDAPRPFRIPGGKWGLAYVCVPPLGVSAAILATTLHDGDVVVRQWLIVAVTVLSGVLLYVIRRPHAASSVKHSAATTRH
jgi:amino acid transporter